MQYKDKEVKQLDGKGKKVGIAVSRFNKDITSGLLESAQKFLVNSGIAEQDIKIIFVPGAVELPSALQKLAETRKFDFLVALGCIIRGETPHFDYVAKMAQEGVLRVMLDYKVPVGFGVLTVENLPQAEARLHVGGEAASAALELSLIKL
jgi:6,7-dimethyl-8-ribityllumazine synthase